MIGEGGCEKISSFLVDNARLNTISMNSSIVSLTDRISSRPLVTGRRKEKQEFSLKQENIMFGVKVHFQCACTNSWNASSKPLFALDMNFIKMVHEIIISETCCSSIEISLFDPSLGTRDLLVGYTRIIYFASEQTRESLVFDYMRGMGEAFIHRKDDC